MKKHIFSCGIILVIMVLTLTGCDIKWKNTKTKTNTEGYTVYNKSFGSYTVPNTWVESKEHSTSSKFFYVQKGQENESQPNNISVNSGTNKYSKDDHEQFKNAILAQLSTQISKEEDVKINASGSTTDNGDIVYTFIMDFKERNAVLTQYYIVGDYKYILVYESVYHEEGDTDEVAKNIVNSFKWE